MIQIVNNPSIIKAEGNKEKIIREFFGRVNSKTGEGWQEPGQCPDFNEYTVVLKGSLKVRTRNDEFIIHEGMGILTSSGEWVQYSSPFDGGVEYIAICLPAFSPDIVHRDLITV